MGRPKPRAWSIRVGVKGRIPGRTKMAESSIRLSSGLSLPSLHKFQTYCCSSDACISGLSRPFPWTSITGAEIKVISPEKPERPEVLSVKPGVSQGIALHASPTARMSAFLSSAFPVHSDFSPLQRTTTCDTSGKKRIYW